MKLRQHITAFSLIAVLTGLSPVVMADAERTTDSEKIQTNTRRDERAVQYRLTPEQMDAVHGGFAIGGFFGGHENYTVAIGGGQIGYGK